MHPLLSTRGRVSSISLNEKGYLVLIVEICAYYQTKFIRFYLLDDQKLRAGKELITEGDTVMVTYHYDAHIAILNSIVHEPETMRNNEYCKCSHMTMNVDEQEELTNQINKLSL